VPTPLLSLILLLLLLVIPVRSLLGMRRRKQLNSGEAPNRGYLIAIASLWGLALQATLLKPASLWTPPTSLSAGIQLHRAC
jgi:hypothetical protein